MPKLKRIGNQIVLGEQTYKTLKEAIITGAFQPGSWLSEDQLTQELGVSRTPVREAFKQLQTEGLIEIFPRKGAYIIELSEKDIDYLFEARFALETTFFFRAAKNIEPAKIHRYLNLFEDAKAQVVAVEHDVSRMKRKWADYLKIDRSFHDELVKASGNPYWLKLYLNIRDRMQLLFFKMGHMPEQAQVLSIQHATILEAMLKNQISEAEKHLKAHILYVRDVHKGLNPLGIGITAKLAV
jgi:DNA-binding GntR family transcriptional regulator